MSALTFLLQKYQSTFHPVIRIAAGERFEGMDFSLTNTSITEELISDTGNLSRFINARLNDAKATYGIGGYQEQRALYKRSKLFHGEEERSLHLGIDIWGSEGTEVFAPLGGMVHSFAFNNNFGDYGATIILQHSLDNELFYTLYGHLAAADLTEMRRGKYLHAGELVGHFGPPEENGNWPPHLHFQIIHDIGFYEGDYPGVCEPSAAERYVLNSPDPMLMLNLGDRI